MAIKDKEDILKLFDKITGEIKYLRSLGEYLVGTLDAEFETLKNKFIDTEDYKEQVEKFLMGVEARIAVICAC